MSGQRTCVVWVPDWPVVAAGVPPHVPAVVVHANRVVAATAAARADGVGRGLRRREAQARCPGAEVLAADPDRDARVFEVVAAAVETLTPRLEIVRPGVCAFATRGPSRYHGGDAALVARTASAVDTALTALVDGADRSGGPVPDDHAVAAGVARCRVGLADGVFAAGLAAREGVVVEPGGTQGFLAPLPVASLRPPELTDLLRRLGLRTLGDLAALDPGDVAGRFGPDGIAAHRLARGLDDRPVGARPPPPDLVVSAELDEPIDNVEAATFVVKTLADDLHQRLGARGLACTRLAIEAETDHGETLSRLWRHEGLLGPAGIAERARWQLDGWLRAPVEVRPTAGVTLVRLVPDEVVPDDGRQLGFWGGDAAAADRAGRAVARVQALLGPDAVGVPVPSGGRSPADGLTVVPVFAADLAVGAQAGSSSGRAPTTADVVSPWPGRVPAPAPVVVPAVPQRAELVDASGGPVGVTGRGVITAEPATLRQGARRHEITAWAGPWLADERWWDPAAHRRRARVQVLCGDDVARLLTLEGGHWYLEAVYD